MTHAPSVRVTRPKAWVWACARAAVTTFYRIERLGPRLPDGALVLVANHPNTLIDPAVIQTTAGRAVRFLAKSTLFRRHPMSLLVRHSGAIPVYRRMDPGVDPSRNAEMFAAVGAVLGDREAVCLFPEGISHDLGHLEPLRTGAARITLDSGARGHHVALVPIGLNFDHMAMFRSRVTAVYGDPFRADDLDDLYAADPADAVRQLTARIEERMRHLLVEASLRHDLPIVTRIDALYASARGVSQDPAQRLGRRRRIAAGMIRLRDTAPERLTEILTRVAAYDEQLERFRLHDRDIDRRIHPGAATRFVVREGLYALVLCPVAALAVTAFAAPYWVTGHLSRLAPDLSSRATWTVALGLGLYAVWIGAAGLLGATVTTPLGGAVTVGALVLLAFAGMRAVERQRSIWRTVRAFLALRQTPLRARAALRRQRASLAAVLEQADAWIEGHDPDAAVAPSPPEQTASS